MPFQYCSGSRLVFPSGLLHWAQILNNWQWRVWRMFGGMLLTPEFLPLEGLRRVIWTPSCSVPHVFPPTVHGRDCLGDKGQQIPQAPMRYALHSSWQMKLQQKQGKTAAYISSSPAEFHCCFPSASPNVITIEALGLNLSYEGHTCKTEERKWRGGDKRVEIEQEKIKSKARMPLSFFPHSPLFLKHLVTSCTNKK